MPEKAKETSAMRRSCGSPKTSRSGPMKMPPAKMRLDRSRDASTPLRTGWTTSTRTRQAAATMSALVCQPTAIARPGRIAPASMLPIGTPVWRIEKSRFIHCGGAPCASMVVEAGVGGPKARPMRMAFRTNAAGWPVDAKARATAASTRHAWLVRSGPNRAMAPPLIRLEKAAMP
jgi:hypothetical protein